MAKMSAARKRHPEITVSLSMSVDTGGGQSVRVPRCHLEGGGTSRSQSATPSPLVPSPPAALRYGNSRRWSWWRGRFDPRSVRASCLTRSAELKLFPCIRPESGPTRWRSSSPGGEDRWPAARGSLHPGDAWRKASAQCTAFNRWWILEQWTRTHACSPLISWVCSLCPHMKAFSFLWEKAPPLLTPSPCSGAQDSTFTQGATLIKPL